MRCCWRCTARWSRSASPTSRGIYFERVRELIGPTIPLVATLDLHANVTKRMVETADALMLYHTAPHIDVMDTGTRGAAALRRILIEGAKPVTAFRKLPMVVPAERANTQDPASVSYRIRKTLEGWERNSFVLSAGLATVQPWLDIPDLGSAVVVVCDASAPPGWGEHACANLANEVWTHRRDYLPELVDISDAVRAAHEQAEGLTVISDSADATTSGSTGDSTALLSELIKYDWPRPALVTLVAPEIVARSGTPWRWRRMDCDARRHARSARFRADHAARASCEYLRREVHPVRPSREELADRHGPLRRPAARQRAHRRDVAHRPALRAAAFSGRGLRSVRGVGADRQESVRLSRSLCGAREADPCRAGAGVCAVGFLEAAVHAHSATVVAVG